MNNLSQGRDQAQRTRVICSECEGEGHVTQGLFPWLLGWPIEPCALCAGKGYTGSWSPSSSAVEALAVAAKARKFHCGEAVEVDSGELFDHLKRSQNSCFGFKPTDEIPAPRPSDRALLKEALDVLEAWRTTARYQAFYDVRARTSNLLRKAGRLP